MSYRVAIIGGGWYGCHIGASLLALGFEVHIFDQGPRLLNEASGNNQFRLHLGFHYPRHHATRTQSRDGFSRFVERYSFLTREVQQNIYAVASEESLIDFQTYRLIMTASGIDFTELETAPDILTNVDGAILANERVLLLARSRAYFVKVLAGRIALGRRISRLSQDKSGVYVDGEKFDYAVDATWGHFLRPLMDVHYEPTILLYYEGPEGYPAITLVDGPLASVYPTEDSKVYTLSSVIHTPLGRFDSPDEARQCRDGVAGSLVSGKREVMESQITRYLPSFRETFRFLGPQLSIKTKPVGGYDDRSCYVFHDQRIFSVMSGKIDTVFFALQRILSLMEVDHYAVSDVASEIRLDIVARDGP
jgi:hypothetical protein